jgi:hypothetical protein
LLRFFLRVFHLILIITYEVGAVITHFVPRCPRSHSWEEGEEEITGRQWVFGQKVGDADE